MWTEIFAYLSVLISSYLSLSPEKKYQNFLNLSFGDSSYSVTSKKTDETVLMVCKISSIFDEILKIYA